MSTNCTTYVIDGHLIDDKENVRELFAAWETDASGFMGRYVDNPYQEEIKKTDSGVHVVADGMNGDYIVIGVILSKTNNQTVPVRSLAPSHKNGSKAIRECLKMEKALGVVMNVGEHGLIFLTHWH